MKKILLTLLPFACSIVLILIFFYPVFTKSFVPLPADHVVGIYYPWIDYKWGGYLAGVPVKNPIAADVVSFMYPMQTFAIDIFKKGLVPLWNPLILTGAPLLANFQSAPFSPTNFLYFLMPKLDAWTIQIILQPILGSIFLYLLLKYFKRSTLASVFGSVAYSFSGFMLIWLEWNGHSLVAGFFPLVILLIFKLLDTKNIVYGILLSMTLALQVFAGYPQIIIYEFIALALGIILIDPKIAFKLKNILMVGVFILLGLGLSATQILPGFELIKLSQRGVEVVENEWALLRLRSAITFVAPDYFGNHASYNYWGPADYTQAVGYSGVVVIVLGLLGFIVSRKERGAKYAMFWIIFALVNAFDNPFSRFLHTSSIFSSQAASAHRILILSNLGFAILATFGLDVIISKKINFRDILKAIAIPGLTLAIYLIFSLLILTWPSLYPNDGSTLTKINSNMHIGLRNLVMPIFLLGFTTIAFLFVKFKSKYSQITAIFLGLVCIAELFRFGWKFTPFTPRELVFPNTPVLQFLQQQQKPFRVNANDVVPINLIMPYGIETIEGYDAVYPLKFAKYISALNSSTTTSSVMGRYGLIFSSESTLLDLANVKYILALKRKVNGQVSPEGQISSRHNMNNYKIILEEGSVAVLENLKVNPRAFMVYKWDVLKGEKAILEKLIDKYPIKERVILEEDINLVPAISGHGTVLYQDEINTKIIQVQTDKPGLLFIADAMYPGWKAYVDGKEEKIQFANYNYMAVMIKNPGSHEVKIEYKPASFETGKMVSLLAIIGLFAISVGWLAMKLIKRRKYA